MKAARPPFLLALLLALAPGPARAAAAPPAALSTLGGWYAAGGFGLRQLANQDANRYFGNSASSPSWQSLLDLGAGYQFPRWLGLELGVQAGPSRDFQASYADGSGGLVQLSTHWVENNYYAMPWLVFSGGEGLFQKPVFQALGLRVGWAELSGYVQSYDTTTQGLGTYNQQAGAFTLGAAYRLQQLITDQIGLCLEIGWDGCRFPYIVNTGATGFSRPIQSPETGFDGTQTALDFSGPYVQVTLVGWLAPPFRLGGAPSPASLASPRTPTAQASGPSPAPDAARASRDNQALGNNFMLEGMARDAQESYQKAVGLDPSNAGAWKGLGTACYTLGEKDQAAQAWKKALDLDPADKDLKALLERLDGE